MTSHDVCSQVRWRHVAWGMALQFILGLIILRWSFGRSVFECLAGKVATFLSFTDAGSGFIFGDLATVDGIFAFSVSSLDIITEMHCFKGVLYL